MGTQLTESALEGGGKNKKKQCPTKIKKVENCFGSDIKLIET